MSSTTRADPRNITDKRYVPTSIRSLIEFLTYHNYDHSISPKILTSPSGKDFNNIVQFLFRLIDSNLSCPGKFEDEVISMFKYLRYPYNISKNGLSAVGSPHSWPQLLASLMWVIELLEYDEEVMSNNENEDLANDVDFDDTSTTEKAFFSYLRNAYVSFLGGDDDAYAELTDDFVRSYESKNEDIVTQTASLEESNAALLREIEEVESRRLFLPQLQSKKKDYVNDMGKFENLIKQLQQHKESSETKINTRMADLEKTNASIKAVEENIDILKEKIHVQELSPEDVRRMSEEKDHLQQSLLSTSETSSNLQKKVWDSELVLRDRVQSMEEAVRLFNSMVEDLDYAVETAKYVGNGNGVSSSGKGKSPSKISKRQLAKTVANMKVNIDIRAKKRSELIQTDVRKDIIPHLQQLKLMLSDATVALKGEIMALQDASEEEELKTVQVQESKLLLESKLRRAEEAYKKEKTALEAFAGSHDREMDELESRLIELRDVSTEEVKAVNAARKLAEVKTTKSNCRDIHRKKKRELIANVMQVVTQAANHREHIQMRLGQLTELHRQRLEGLLLMGGEAIEVAATLTADVFSPEIVTEAEALSTSQALGRGDNGNAYANVSPTPIQYPPPLPPTTEKDIADLQDGKSSHNHNHNPNHNHNISLRSDNDNDSACDLSDISKQHYDDEEDGICQQKCGAPLDLEGEEEEEEEDTSMRFVSNLSKKFTMDDAEEERQIINLSDDELYH